LPSLPPSFESHKSADHMLDDILKKVKAAYDCCSAYTSKNGAGRPHFEWQVKFLTKVSKLKCLSQ